MRSVNIIQLLGVAALLVALSVMAVSADTYKPPQHCYKKCTHYKYLKGKCVDYEWRGTKKECCKWKTVGKGKCDLYKRKYKCDKYSKSRYLCLGHGYKQVCDKVTQHKFCKKFYWKGGCKKKGYNHKCDQYAYHFLCTKYDTSSRCTVFTYIPKIKYYYKTRCNRYAVHQYCAKYKTITKTIPKWKKVSRTHYLGWTDVYYHQYLNYKKYQICVVYAKKKYCTGRQNVRFVKKVSYERKCIKAVTRKYCVAKKRVRFCTKWSPTKYCKKNVKFRVCRHKKTQSFCCKYKAVPFCTQYKKIKPRCIKRSFKRYCAHYSNGHKICKKYQFVGGKKYCRKRAKRSVCDSYKTICTKIDTYKPAIDSYKPTIDSYKPKIDSYKP
ncbi:hypothetical protein FDP41_004030 [Naegleria fowleri]|uniref:Uncharacterized protein n=1 Tax=Naegleria fowleri TaxID=5763 RepID=A0A6A5BTK5_NAEFO|nr:uncharacterized protein FDP41_004030 [Naegleria fowleri]KAF0976735.1 hypothetical protein FDP41_004030 [Naegleria fowleri]